VLTVRHNSFAQSTLPFEKGAFRRQTSRVQLAKYLSNFSDFLELNPSPEPSSCTVTEEFPDILLNPEVHHGILNSPAMTLILSQINPVSTTPSYFFRTHFNIILLAASLSSQCLIPSGFHTKFLYAFLFSLMYAYLSLIYFVFLIKLVGEYKL
jgi:hypothetical protein